MNPKFKVLAVANSEDMRLTLRQRLLNEEALALVGFANMDTNVLAKISGYAPHVVLLVQDESSADVLQIAQRIYQGFPGCALVLIAPQPDIQLVRNAMQVGIRQVVSAQELDTLKDVLIEAAVFERGRTGEIGHEPRVISIYGGKGGCGKTTIAVNLAAALAQTGMRTALIDLCLTFGDVAVLLNITDKDSIAELVQERSNFGIEDIKSFSMQHSSGVSVLCAPSSPEYAEYVMPRHVEALINTMRPYYDFIVLDLPTDFTECTLTAMENSDDIMLVMRPDISNLRAAKLTLGVLTTLQQQEKVLPVINADRKGMLTYKDFERILERPIICVLPEDVKNTHQSQQRGVPFVLGVSRAPISQALLQLAKRWTGNTSRRKAK